MNYCGSFIAVPTAGLLPGCILDSLQLAAIIAFLYVAPKSDSCEMGRFAFKLFDMLAPDLHGTAAAATAPTVALKH